MLAEIKRIKRGRMGNRVSCRVFYIEDAIEDAKGLCMSMCNSPVAGGPRDQDAKRK